VKQENKGNLDKKYKIKIFFEKLLAEKVKNTIFAEIYNDKLK